MESIKNHPVGYVAVLDDSDIPDDLACARTTVGCMFSSLIRVGTECLCLLLLDILLITFVIF